MPRFTGITMSELSGELSAVAVKISKKHLGRNPISSFLQGFCGLIMNDFSSIQDKSWGCSIELILRIKKLLLNKSSLWITSYFLALVNQIGCQPPSNLMYRFDFGITLICLLLTATVMKYIVLDRGMISFPSLLCHLTSRKVRLVWNPGKLHKC